MAETIVIDADEAYESSQKAEPDAAEGVEEVSEAAAEEGAEGTGDVEIEVEGKKTQIDSEGSEVGQLRGQIRELQDELLRVSARLQQPVPEVKAPKEEEQLTRAQLAQIIAENSDKPEVLLNVIDYMAEQKTKAVKNEAFKELSESNWHREIAGSANQVLMEDRDGYIAANPRIKEKIGQVAKNMKWENHPAGALAAYALIRLGEGFVSQEEAKKVSAGKPQKETKTASMDKTRSLSAGKKNNKLTAEHLEMAKRLGIKDPNLMARFIP